MLFVTCSRRCDSTASLRVKGRWEKETSSLFSYFNLFFIHSFPFLLSAQWVWIGLLWWITLLVLLSACMWINGCRVRMFLLCSPLSSICLFPPFFPKFPPPILFSLTWAILDMCAENVCWDRLMYLFSHRATLAGTQHTQQNCVALKAPFLRGHSD